MKRIVVFLSLVMLAVSLIGCSSPEGYVGYSSITSPQQVKIERVEGEYVYLTVMTNREPVEPIVVRARNPYPHLSVGTQVNVYQSSSDYQYYVESFNPSTVVTAPVLPPSTGESDPSPYYEETPSW